MYVCISVHIQMYIDLIYMLYLTYMYIRMHH